MTRSNRLGFALAGIAAISFGCGIISCSSSGGGSPSNDNTGGSTGSNGGSGNSGNSSGTTTACAENLTIAFAPDMYSAYIPNSSHTFQIPVLAQGVSNAMVHWSADDMSMVKIDPGADVSGATLLTMTGTGANGTTKIYGRTDSGLCGSSTLHVTAATEDEWNAGNMRYNSGNPLPKFTTDGGVPNIIGYVIDPPGMPPACTNCHGDTATTNTFKTVSHTPEQTGGFSDDQLIQIFTQAAVPMDGYFDNNVIPIFIWQFFHKWTDITGDTQKGVVVYLRSLVPKPQTGTTDISMFPRPNFRQPGQGGMTGSGGTTSSSTGGTTSSSTGGKTSSSTGGTTSSSTGGTSGTGGTKATGGTAGAAGSAGAAGASSGGAGGSSGAGGASGSGGSAGTGGTK
jgi:hypothetical protein